jgi:L-ribulokinase
MKEPETGPFVIGIDYGTDSCRALIVNALTGQAVCEAVCEYPRWKKGLYCNPTADQYRQHPLDYIESFENVVKEVVSKAGDEVVSNIRGIAFDTTASTPVLTDSKGTPLALTKGFEEDPDAMFVLWKDHTAKKEADDINALSSSYGVDYTAYSGGTYSAEWAWSKVLHILRNNDQVRKATYSWVEHCDWMSGLLTGNTDPETIMHSRCAAGHKAMWRAEWGGLPSEEFLTRLDAKLGEIRSHLYTDTFTADTCEGEVTEEFSRRLGLPRGVKVAVGSVDAHVGAVGASIEPNVLTRIMGTSTCDILVCDKALYGDRKIRGICGQVDGSVVPGLTGFEAGQSAFGDIYAWFRKILLWATEEFTPAQAEEIERRILPSISKAASKVPVGASATLALDWMNGRRTPDANQNLRGAITGLTLGTSAPMIFRALVEATAYGSKAIIDRFISEGIEIKSIRAIGGISQKDPFVMQTLSDVLGMPIDVMATDQACALGAAMFASVACGIHPDIAQAQRHMGAPVGHHYVPSQKDNAVYEKLYRQYLKLGKTVEEHQF